MNYLHWNLSRRNPAMKGKTRFCCEKGILLSSMKYFFLVTLWRLLGTLANIFPEERKSWLCLHRKSIWKWKSSQRVSGSKRCSWSRSKRHKGEHMMKKLVFYWFPFLLELFITHRPTPMQFEKANEVINPSLPYVPDFHGVMRQTLKW